MLFNSINIYKWVLEQTPEKIINFITSMKFYFTENILLSTIIVLSLALLLCFLTTNTNILLPENAFKVENKHFHPEQYKPSRRWHLAPFTALITSFIVLFQTMELWDAFLGGLYLHTFNQDTFFFYYDLYNIKSLPGHIQSGIILNIDGISLCFIVLTAIIFPICFIANFKIEPIYKGNKLFTICLISILFLLILTFSCIDIIFFYIFFESILIPMFLVIGIWGARSRKVKAALYFFLYTLFGSLVMLFGLLYLIHITGNSSYDHLLNTVFSQTQQMILWPCFFMAFAAKIPMVPLHIWLPEAHVEAPTVGSVILASLLLKLGGYGFLRFSIRLFSLASKYLTVVINLLGVISVIYASLTAIRQVDLKRIVAYSSVAHMNIIVIGMFVNNQQGIDGSLYLMIAHGIVSSALFFCIGVLYERYHTRLLRYFGGLTTTMPLFSIIFFLFTLANMSFPGTSNFIGELLILFGIFKTTTDVLFLCATSIVLSAVYSIWLYNRICNGAWRINAGALYTDLNVLEFSIFLPLIILMVILGINSNVVTDIIAISSNSLLY